ncbi:roadblock/LC7 domain-containing protein [Streptomyces syringium]|uniref:roadblock/LC7 domain-containing protein n=1 Tax=Streptomyces syringium TaxID=76729 RepID=UPI0037CD6597
MYTDYEFDARLLDTLVAVPGVRGAMVLPLDGLVRVYSTGLERQEADRLAAALAAAHGTHRVISEFCAPGDASWRMTLVEFGTGFVLTIAAGDDVLLSVSTTGDADVGGVADRMRALVLRRNGERPPASRSDVTTPRTAPAPRTRE